MSFTLSEIDDCGHDSFYDFGRCLYKYTDCGPWVTAVLLDGTEVYYEDREARELPMSTVVDHVKVGSIVEGSDVYVGPFDVHDPKKFGKVVESIDDEADFYWKRDNTYLFTITRPGYTDVVVRENWGDVEWESGFPFWIRRTHRQELEAIMHDPDGEEWTIGPYTMKLVDQSWDTY